MKRIKGAMALLYVGLAAPLSAGAHVHAQADSAGADQARVDAVKKAQLDLFEARQKQLASQADSLPPEAAERFHRVLLDAVALYRQTSDNKAMLVGLSYVFSYCKELGAAADAQRCRELKGQAEPLILSRFGDSPEILSFMLSATDADLPFVERAYKQSVHQKLLIAASAGNLWAQRCEDMKTREQDRQAACREVVKYGHALEQDASVVHWGARDVPMNRWKGEGLIERVQAQAAGRVMPDYGWQSFDGAPVSLKELRGKVVLLDFWATWCVPCVASMPRIRQLREELAGKPFEVVSINADGSSRGLKKVIEFQKKKVSMPWVNWWLDTDSEDYFRLGLGGLPTYIVLSDKGTIVFRAEHFDDTVKQQVRAAVSRVGGT